MYTSRDKSPCRHGERLWKRPFELFPNSPLLQQLKESGQWTSLLLEQKSPSSLHRIFVCSQGLLVCLCASLLSHQVYISF